MNSIDRKPAAHQLAHVVVRSQPDETGHIALQERCIQARGNEVARSHDQDLVRQVACSFTGDPHEPERRIQARGNEVARSHDQRLVRQVACSFTGDPHEPELARVAVQEDDPPHIVAHRRKREDERPDPNAAMVPMQPVAPPPHVDTIKNHGRTRGELSSVQTKTNPIGPSMHDERAGAPMRVGRARTRPVKHVMPVAVAALPGAPTPRAPGIGERLDRAARVDERLPSKGGTKTESAREPLDVRAQRSLTLGGALPRRPLGGSRLRSVSAQPAQTRSPEPNLRGEPFQPRPDENLSRDHPASNGDTKREGAREPLDVRGEPAVTQTDTPPAAALGEGQRRPAEARHAESRSPMANAAPNNHGKSSQPHPVRGSGDVLPASKADMKPKGAREHADVGADHALAHAGTQTVHPLSASPLRAAEQHTGARSPVPEAQGKPSEFDDEVPAVMRSGSTATRTIHYDFKTWVGQPGVDVRANLESGMHGVTVSTSDDTVAKVLESRADELSAPVVKVRRDGDDEEPSRRRRVLLLQEDD
ncbi:hypothetical protein BamIOP4010DRAFT_1288 [Burkholderia ambifaria IOP40-10]|uniref:Surface presentation of antigen domain-containing protein n=1 Tax=Burkholderia ambifaria IOP40-10 TaxID=396596 RepID=B1FB79_9BURK|nr:hypothetical protein [Burkholderia ambifaria]EDT05161.1 hypothetical protein BamIOP4010DRAFT_1288 [Burkholderia ambifaria IOP40-10]